MAANSERIIGLEPDGSVPVTIVSGGGTGGTASSFGNTFPPTGTAAGFIDSGGNMAGASLDSSGNLLVNVAAGSLGSAKTIKSLTGSLTADTDLIGAVSLKRIKVIGYAFFTFGTSATTIILKSNGTSGTALWTVALQAITSSVMGANLAVAAPSWVFATAAGEKLTADTNTGDTVYWSISYFDDDAT